MLCKWYMRGSVGGWVWFRYWQSTVSVVDCQCRRIQIVQFLHVRPVKLFPNLAKVVSESKTLIGWELAGIGA